MPRKSLCIVAIFSLFLAASIGFAAAPQETKSVQETATPQWYYSHLVDEDYVAQFAKLPPDPKVWVIDVRERNIYQDGHIFSAFNIPGNKLNELSHLLPKNKNIELIFYCDGPDCQDSHDAARTVEKLGYTTVKVFAGGLEKWKLKYEVVDLGKKAASEGFRVVDYAYMKEKVGNGLRKIDKVVILDARPENMYIDGHIPSAISLPSMNFDQVYPNFEKLNIAKNTEIILGVGRECPLSLKNAQRLKEKGYTNLKLYIEPPIWHGNDYLEIGFDAAKEMNASKISFVDARSDVLFKKGTIEGAVNVPAAKFDEYSNMLPQEKAKPVVSFCQDNNCVESHELVAKMKKIGYANVMVFAGGYSEWEKLFASGGGSAKKESQEGTIDVAAFEKMLEEKSDKILLIDVRSSAEFSTGSFKNSINMSVDDLEKKLNTLPSEKRIIFVCSTGARSGEAYYMVKDQRPDLKDVYYIDAEISFSKDGTYKIVAHR